MASQEARAQRDSAEARLGPEVVEDGPPDPDDVATETSILVTLRRLLAQAAAGAFKHIKVKDLDPELTMLVHMTHSLGVGCAPARSWHPSLFSCSMYIVETRAPRWLAYAGASTRCHPRRGDSGS